LRSPNYNLPSTTNSELLIEQFHIIDKIYLVRLLDDFTGNII